MRIAIFRALYLGDLLVAVPAFRAIRAGFPDAEITLIGLPWAETFVRRFAHYLDRFVEFAGYPGIQEVEVDAERTARFLQEQRAHGYDLVIQMHGSGSTSMPLALQLGGRITVGYYQDAPAPESPHDSPCSIRGDGGGTGRATILAPYPGHQPEILRNLGLPRLIGCPDPGTHLEFPVAPSDRVEASLLLKDLHRTSRPWIGIHPGSKSPSRRWPAEYFAATADALTARLHAQVILTGGPGEEEMVGAVAERMRTRPLNLAGKTSLGGLGAVIDELDLFISNDTGPAHMAQARGVPSVILFGPVDHRRWMPLDRSRHRIVRQPVECSPCDFTECPIDHRCLRSISPSRVIDLAAEMLGLREVA